MKVKLRNKGARVRKQIAGGFMSPEWVKNPDLAEPYIKRAAKAGYFAWVMFTRQMKQSIEHPRVHAAMKKISRLMHKHGIKFILDTDPTWWAEELIEERPETALWCITPARTTAVNGAFYKLVPAPGVKSPQHVFKEVSALYIFPDGKPRLLKKKDYSFDWQNRNKPMDGTDIKGRIKNGYSGPVLIYVAVTQSALIDHAHPSYLKMQRKLLNCYRDVKIDGVCWDEPGKGHGKLTEFRAGEGLLALFKERNGYDLRSKLIYLDHFDGTPEAVRVRGDYFSTMSDMHYRAQQAHNRHARRLWGKDIICGSHQTWSGLPCDLGAGVMDHIKLGELLTGAWTDGGVDFERKINAFPLMLADSIKKELCQRDSYYNNWSYSPSVELNKFFLRYMTLYHINTFIHTYSYHSETLCNMQVEPIKSVYDKEQIMLDRFDQLVGERLSDTDVAIWYGWEGYAAAPKWCARATYTFFQNISLILTDRGVYGDFVSGPAIAGAKIENKRLVMGENSYRVIVVPNAHAIPREVYRALIRAAKAGVKVVFTGLPPQFTETGNKIDFCKTMSVEPVTISDFENALAANDVSIPIDAWEPLFVDMVCPVTPLEATVQQNSERECIALKAPRGELYWMPGLDPREDLVDLIEPWCESKVEIYSPNAYSRVFSNRDDANDFVLVLAPREGTPGMGLVPERLVQGEIRRPDTKHVKLKVLARVNGKELRVAGAPWCAIHFVDGKIVAYLADDSMRIQYDGKKIL